MATGLPDLSDEVQRQLAAGLFNHAWTLLEKKGRTVDEDDAMLHAAHASRHFWGQVGTPLNRARGEWQLARVYAELRRAEPALHHALRCRALCEQHHVGAFDLAFAYEALARAHAVGANVAERDRFVERARETGQAIEKPEDRHWLEENLQTVFSIGP